MRDQHRHDAKATMQAATKDQKVIAICLGMMS